MGTAFTCAAAFRYMKNTGGSIINYASYAGECGFPSMPAYSAAKGAVIAYSRTIARDWAKYGIRVNIVCPLVLTELAERALNGERGPQLRAFIETSVPLGRWGKPEEAANLNVFLASDMASFITGQLICVDGGWLMPR